MRKICEKVNMVAEAVLFVLVSVMILVVFAQVCCRYFLNAPLPWAEEVARYTMIWIVYLGASVGINRGAHVGFSFFVEKSSPKVAKILAIISTTAVALFVTFYTYYGVLICQRTAEQLTASLQIPMAVVYAALPISGILCLFQLVNAFINLVNPEESMEEKQKGA